MFGEKLLPLDLAESSHADFKSSRLSNFLTGLGLLIIPAFTFYLSLYESEEELLETRARRGGGFIKLIEQTVGWDLFVILMIAFGIWGGIYSIVSFWKAIDATPDLRALVDRIEFHPAVRNSSVTYNEVSHWFVEFVSGYPVVWIHFYEPYWSLQGLFKRKTIKLEGDKEKVRPIVGYFSRHPVMKRKFLRK
jgi:hypothetical protein